HRSLGHHAPGRGGRGRRRGGAERKRQEHAQARNLGARRRAHGRARVRERLAGRTEGARDREPRHRPRSGGPPHLPAAHRGGQPQDGRLSAECTQGVRRVARARVRPVPRPPGAPEAARRQPLRRRAADARDRSRADVAAQADPARRALDGVGTRDGAPPLRPHPPRARGGLHDPRGRAERPPGAEARRPRVPARGRADQDGRARRRAVRAGLRAEGIRGAVIDPIFLLEAAVNGVLLGGVLALLRSFATFLWTTDHKTVRPALPILEVGGMFLSCTRLIAFAISLVAMLGLWVFLRRTYIGTAIRAVSQDREAMALMGADPQRVYFVTSAVRGALAGLAGELLIIQYSVHPFLGTRFR